MRIACPSCETAYEVPESVVTARRKMRCARCRTEFLPDAPVLPVAPAPEPPVLPATPVPLVAPLEEERTTPLHLPEAAMPAHAARGIILAAWAVSVAVVLAMGWSAIVWRYPIEHAWPPSGRLYMALGYK